MDKLITKENVVIVVAVITIIVQSNYFATKLDLANIKLEMSQLKSELKEYSDTHDNYIIQNMENKFQILSDKLDKKK